MNLAESPIYKEILAIFNNAEKPSRFHWEAKIHVGDTTVAVYSVNSIDVSRDYVKEVAESRIINLNMPGGQFDKYVEPNKTNLEITLTRRSLTLVGGVEEVGKEIGSQRYRAILRTLQSGVLEKNKPLDGDIEKKDKFEIMEVEFELQPKILEEIRMTSFGAPFRNCLTIDVVRFVLGYFSKNKKIEKENEIKGVDVAPNFVTEKREHVIVPHHMPLIKVPRYIHEKQGGVYSAGFGFFLQNNMWYVYAPFDLSYYEKARGKTLTIVRVMKDRLAEAEQTYRETDKQVIIMATGQVKQKDISEFYILNKGHGVRFMKASSVMGNFVDTDDNKAIADIARSTVEINIEERENGMTHMGLSDVPITDNVPFEKSKMAPLLGQFLSIEWNNAMDSVIYPGMPTKYVYEEGGEVHELHGTVVGGEFAHIRTGTLGSNQGREYRCQGSLHLFLSKKTIVNQSGKPVKL